MKRVLFLSACAVLLLTSVPFGQTLGNAKLLYHTTDSVRWTQCAFGPDGVLWVVWVPGDTNSASGGPVWVLSYDGTTISEPVDVTDTTGVLANRPHISTTSKGHVLVSWGVVATKSIYLRIYDPKTGWGTIETVSTGKGGDEPCAFMDKSGNVHVLFGDETGGVVYARSKINGVWETEAKLSSGFGKQGSLAFGSDGTAHAVWIERVGTSNVFENYYSSRTAAATWAAKEGVSGQSGSSNHPWVTVGPNNMPVMVWEDLPYPDTPAKGSEIRVLAIGSTVELAIALFYQHFPRVVVDRNGIIHVACQTGGGDAGNGIRYTNNGSGVFRTVQAISAVYPKLPGLAADPYGNVAATTSSYVTGSGGGTDIWAYSINPIVAIPPPVAAFNFSPVTGYPPLTVSFRAVPSYGPNGVEVNYDWMFGDGGTASGRNVNHVYQTAGTYNIRLAVIDSLGRTDQEIKSIVIKKTNPLAPVNLSATIVMSRFWQNPEITFNLFWAANPANIPEHIEGYAIYMKADGGDYVRLLTVSPSTFSASFAFTDLKVNRYFAVSTLGKGGTESPWVYFQ
ncbi:MAG: PKD domain-containing protein [Candidatus Aminicenantes bacterium]|nr:PKD domain-containing protein [Candidatus Aminicenantes bacterium]